MARTMVGVMRQWRVMPVCAAPDSPMPSAAAPTARSAVTPSTIAGDAEPVVPARSYRTSDFDFPLPPELIAQRPSARRADSRLLEVGTRGVVDRRFRDFPQLLARGDLLIFNDTRVVKSRLAARKPTGGKVELLLERILDRQHARFQLRASHPPGVGGQIDLPGGMTARVLARDGRFFDLELAGVESVADYLERYAATPLPPYITRPPDRDDEARYQTVYARVPGAVAAPTAGLHFDPEMFDRLRAAGVDAAFVTLHVGAGTFQPVTVEDPSAHVMHAEHYCIPESTVAAVLAARARGGRVVAIGTTSLRALEAGAGSDGTLHGGSGETRLFITPGYRFRLVDRLLTNFHLPRSTLLMLVCAFAGHEHIRAAYAHAIAQRYRFFSYGDAMLLDRLADAPPPMDDR